MGRGTRQFLYSAGAAVLLGLYALAAAVLLAGKDFGDTGPLSRNQPALTAPLPGGISVAAVLATCFPERADDAVSKVVGGTVEGRGYYACYAISGVHVGQDADVLDLRGRRVGDAGVIKRGGAWPWVGSVNDAGDFVTAGLVSLAVLALFWIWHLLRRPVSAPSRRRRWRKPALVTAGIVLGVIGFYVWATTMVILAHPDAWGLAATGIMAASSLYGAVAGAALVAGRTPFTWFQLEPGQKELAAALFAFVVVLPVLVGASVFTSALGGLLVSRTQWHGQVLAAAGVSLVVAIGVSFRWQRARDTLDPAERPSTAGAIAVGAAALVAVVAVAVPLYGLFDWFGLEIDPGVNSAAVAASATDETDTVATEEDADPLSDASPREAGVFVAAGLAHNPDEVVDVDCAEPSASGAADCTVILVGFVCQAWVSTGPEGGPYRAKPDGVPVHYTRVFTDLQTGRTTCS